MAHFLRFLAQFVTQILQILRQPSRHLPDIVEEPRQRREGRHSESSGRENSGDGEADSDGGRDKNGAENDEERGGDGEADE